MAVLHHHVFGDPDGRPTVALHGVSGHGGRWRRLAQRYTTGLRVVGLDLRGHGHSLWTPPWNLEQHAADVLETMDALGLSTVDIIGHSFGGAVALTATTVAPQRFRRMVLLDPGLALHPGYVLTRATQELTPPSYADRDEATRDRSARWPALSDPMLVTEELDEHLVQGEDGRWGWRYAAPAVVTAFSEMTRTPPLPPIGVPTLVVVASQGSAVGQPFLDALAGATNRNVRVIELDSGHTVYVDRPEQTGALVQEFLD